MNIRRLVRLLIAYSVVASLPNACGRDGSADPVSPSGQWSATGEWTGRVVIVNDPDAPKWPADPLTITSATVLRDSLVVAVTYGGGCQTRTFDLLSDAAWMESHPVQVRLRLAHESNDDPCDALLSSVLRFDLTPLRSAWVQSYQASSGSMVLRLEGTSGVTWQF